MKPFGASLTFHSFASAYSYIVLATLSCFVHVVQYAPVPLLIGPSGHASIFAVKAIPLSTADVLHHTEASS